jgi:hypothetical protein
MVAIHVSGRRKCASGTLPPSILSSVDWEVEYQKRIYDARLDPAKENFTWMATTHSPSLAFVLAVAMTGFYDAEHPSIL